MRQFGFHLVCSFCLWGGLNPGFYPSLLVSGEVSSSGLFISCRVATVTMIPQKILKMVMC